MLGPSRDEPNPGLDRVAHELRADGIKYTPNPLRSGIHSRGYLPHVKREGAEYFVTFRLADALPKQVLMQFEHERAERLRLLEQALREGWETQDTQDAINRDHQRHIERYLDKGYGACHLRRADIAALVSNSLRCFDRQRYQLGDWVVMPNHVHVILWPMPNRLLSDILKSWKQFTSVRAKRILMMSEESFWQRESFDRWIRDDTEKARICRYIQFNPVSAGLCARPEDWPWSSASALHRKPS